MKRLLKAAAALLCAFGFTIAQAQMTTITASSISMGGVPISAGTVTFTPVNSSGIAIPFATGGGGLNAPTAFSGTITAGAIVAGFQTPDACLTSPANILYTVQITNTATQKSFTLQQVPNVCGTTWALDHYGPPANTSNVQPVQVAYGTAAPPDSCVSPSFYVRNYSGGQLWVCVAGAFVQVTGSGGSSYTFTNGLNNASGTVSPVFGTTANTVTQGNDSRFAANAAAAAAAQVTANAAVGAVPQAILPFAVDAEWPFNDGSGTTISDISGNGHSATFGSGSAAPSWVPYGVAFNSTGDTFPNRQFALTNITTFKSIIIAHCIYPEIQTTATGGNEPYPQVPALWGSSTNDGINFSGGQSVGGGQNFGAFRPSTVSVNPFGNKAVAVEGFGQCQTSALTVGANDALYENGLPVALAQTGSSASSLVSSGGYEFGADSYGAGISSYRGTITYALLSISAVWTPAQVQQLDTYIRAKLAARNLPVYPTFNQSLSNQLIFAGDSIWAGHGGTGVWTSLLTLNNTYTVSNWSVAGMLAWDVGRLAESRWYSQIAPSAARNVVVFNAGTNDLAGTFTASATWASIALEAKKAIKVGAIPVISTIISRSGYDSAIAPLNTLIRSRWKQAGFAMLLDAAEIPQFAAGAYSNATYYQVDGVHPAGGSGCTSGDGYGLLCLAASKVVNTLDGSSSINPDASSSNAFVATDANNYLIQTPTAAATYQLVGCMAITGQAKTIVNGSTSFGITVSATSPDTIVGSTSIPAGTSGTYIATVASPTAGGCYWLRQ